MPDPRANHFGNREQANECGRRSVWVIANGISPTRSPAQEAAQQPPVRCAQPNQFIRKLCGADYVIKELFTLLIGFVYKHTSYYTASVCVGIHTSADTVVFLVRSLFGSSFARPPASRPQLLAPCPPNSVRVCGAAPNSVRVCKAAFGQLLG